MKFSPMEKLTEYFKKRDFSKSPEPQATRKFKRGKEPIFVIQRHEATHLHYDFRLEKDGVLKSWAIPKQPPTEFNIKRLAIQVEDHPLDYADFAGEIPHGLYGAGKVKIWDKGSYALQEWGPQKIIFELKGDRLRGNYCLLKLRPKLSEDKNWLFFKVSDFQSDS